MLSRSTFLGELFDVENGIILICVFVIISNLVTYLFNRLRLTNLSDYLGFSYRPCFSLDFPTLLSVSQTPT